MQTEKIKPDFGSHRFGHFIMVIDRSGPYPIIDGVSDTTVCMTDDKGALKLLSMSEMDVVEILEGIVTVKKSMIEVWDDLDLHPTLGRVH